MRSLFLSLALLLVAPMPTAIAAPSPPPSDANLAQALFASGKDAMAKGDLATAEKRFTESLKLDPAVGTLLNLAACEEKAGKLVNALTHFMTARTQLPKDDFRVAFTNEKIDALTPRVPKIILKFPSGRPAKARVLKDGQELDANTLDSPVLVDPGTHLIVYENEKNEVTLREGEEKILELGASSKGSSAPPSPTSGPTTTTTTTTTTQPKGPDTPADQASTTDNPKRTWAWVSAGVAVTGLATGAITGLMTISAASTYKDHCTDGECDQDGLDAASTGRTTRWVSPIGFGIGIAAGIVSAWLFVSSSPSSPSTPATGGGGGARRRIVPSGNGVVVHF
jgi:hypothetical protein